MSTKEAGKKRKLIEIESDQETQGNELCRNKPLKLDGSNSSCSNGDLPVNIEIAFRRFELSVHQQEGQEFRFYIQIKKDDTFFKKEIKLGQAISSHVIRKLVNATIPENGQTGRMSKREILIHFIGDSTAKEKLQFTKWLLNTEKFDSVVNSHLKVNFKNRESYSKDLYTFNAIYISKRTIMANNGIPFEQFKYNVLEKHFDGACYQISCSPVVDNYEEINNIFDIWKNRQESNLSNSILTWSSSRTNCSLAELMERDKSIYKKFSVGALLQAPPKMPFFVNENFVREIICGKEKIPLNEIKCMIRGLLNTDGLSTIDFEPQLTDTFSNMRIVNKIDRWFHPKKKSKIADNRELIPPVTAFVRLNALRDPNFPSDCLLNGQTNLLRSISAVFVSRQTITSYVGIINDEIFRILLEEKFNENFGEDTTIKYMEEENCTNRKKWDNQERIFIDLGEMWNEKRQPATNLLNASRMKGKRKMYIEHDGNQINHLAQAGNGLSYISKYSSMKDVEQCFTINLPLSQNTIDNYVHIKIFVTEKDFIDKILWNGISKRQLSEIATYAFRTYQKQKIRCKPTLIKILKDNQDEWEQDNIYLFEDWQTSGLAIGKCANRSIICLLEDRVNSPHLNRDSINRVRAVCFLTKDAYLFARQHSVEPNIGLLEILDRIHSVPRDIQEIKFIKNIFNQEWNENLRGEFKQWVEGPTKKSDANSDSYQSTETSKSEGIEDTNSSESDENETKEINYESQETIL